jgi:hypothetical protein
VKQQTQDSVRRILRRAYIKARFVALFSHSAFPLPARVRQQLALKEMERRNLRRWKHPAAESLELIGRKNIFLHIPKNAGTSLKEALWKQAGFVELEDVLNGAICPSDAENITVNHLGLDWLIKHKFLSATTVKSSNLFAIVRDPVDRFYSLYRYFVMLGRIPSTWNELDFLEAIKKSSPQIGGAKVARLSQCSQQVQWVYSIPLGSNFRCFRLEEGLRTFSAVEELLGSKLSVSNKNRTTRFPIKSNPNLIRSMVFNIYSQDFDAFGYSPLESVPNSGYQV